MAAIFICSKSHKAGSCLQLGMYCEVLLPPSGCSWLLSRVAEYLFIHWHLKAFLIYYFPAWWMGLYHPQELIRLALDELGGYWWPSWDREVVGVSTTGSSGRWWPPQAVKRGRKDKLWGLNSVVLVPAENGGVRPHRQVWIGLLCNRLA